MNTVLFTSRNVELMLRTSLSIVYAWFGALKLLDASPAHDLVVATLPMLSPSTAVAILGWWEVILAVFLLVPRLTSTALMLFAFHMLGTFLPLVTVANVTWLEPPLVLSLVGQYIVKNVVFLAAGAAVYFLHGIRR
jgi:uncharacterized membrane protein